MKRFAAMIAVGCFLVIGVSGCAMRCQTCKTIEKNNKLIDKWISKVGAEFEKDITYVAGPPPRLRIAQGGGGLGRALGSAFGGGLSLGAIAKDSFSGEASKYITCEPNPDEVCEHCPKHPKLVFTCRRGEDCKAETAECQDTADRCFEKMIQAAINSHNDSGNYYEDRVKQAMTNALENEPDCQAVVGMHANCHADSCSQQADATSSATGEDPAAVDAELAAMFL